MISDKNLRITEIIYNNLNLPVYIKFSNASIIENQYDATGSLICRKSRYRPYSLYIVSGSVREVNSTKYFCDDFEYRSPSLLTRINITNGYIASNVIFYYIKDYQGNVRQVVNGDTEEVVQENSYYPYGMSFIMDDNWSTSNVYRFGSKELISTLDINCYDFIGRYMDPATLRFWMHDPLQEKYYSGIYQYCFGTPINYIDPDGD